MTDADTSELPGADIMEIRRLLPHRYPFLFIDRVRDMKMGESPVGIKNVSVNEPHFQGHFPSKPIMPGVTIVEAMAQTSCVLVIKTLGLEDTDVLVYFMTMDKTRFRKLVMPGDVLELHVSVIRSRGKIWKFWGEAKVDGKIVAESEYSAMIVMPDEQ